MPILILAVQEWVAIEVNMTIITEQAVKELSQTTNMYIFYLILCYKK